MSLFTTRTPMIDLIVPPHVSWSFDDVQYAPIKNTPTSKFTFEYSFGLTADPVLGLKEAVREALTQLYAKANRRLAICVSGADSEIIAREASSLQIPFDLFFLDLWDLNSDARAKVQALSVELGANLTVIRLSKEKAVSEVLPETYPILQCLKPTYLVLPYLLKQIPARYYIVGGEGDPEKSDLNYKYEDGKLPISVTEVFYRQWAIQNNRACEMYFFACTENLIKAYYNNPLLTKSAHSILTRTLRDSVWPDLLFKTKTTNWEQDFNQNMLIQSAAAELRGENPYQFAPKVTLVG